MRRLVVVLPAFGLPALLLLLGGCGGQDPILDRADALSVGGGGTALGPAPAGAPPAAAQPGQPEAGRAADPRPGVAGSPPAGVPDQPPAGSGDGGAAVTLSGTIEIAGWSGGPIRIDVFDGDQVAAAGSDRRPNVVAQARLEKPGVFAVSVPVSANKVWIGAFADEDRDGKPGREDPSGWYGDNPVDLGADRGGLALKISRPEPPPSGGLQ